MAKQQTKPPDIWKATFPLSNLNSLKTEHSKRLLGSFIFEGAFYTEKCSKHVAVPHTIQNQIRHIHLQKQSYLLRRQCHNGGKSFMPHKSKCLKTPSYYGEDEVNAQNCLIPLELNWGGKNGRLAVRRFYGEKSNSGQDY